MMSDGNLRGKTLIVAALILAATAGACAAFSWTDADWVACLGAGKHTVEQVIAACTSKIESAGETSADRAFAYSLRGSAYFRQNDDTRAKADFDVAIALAP